MLVAVIAVVVNVADAVVEVAVGFVVETSWLVVVALPLTVVYVPAFG